MAQLHPVCSPIPERMSDYSVNKVDAFSGGSLISRACFHSVGCTFPPGRLQLGHPDVMIAGVESLDSLSCGKRTTRRDPMGSGGLLRSMRPAVPGLILQTFWMMLPSLDLMCCIMEATPRSAGGLSLSPGEGLCKIDLSIPFSSQHMTSALDAFWTSKGNSPGSGLDMLTAHQLMVKRIFTTTL